MCNHSSLHIMFSDCNNLCVYFTIAWCKAVKNLLLLYFCIPFPKNLVNYYNMFQFASSHDVATKCQIPFSTICDTVSAFFFLNLVHIFWMPLVLSAFFCRTTFLWHRNVYEGWLTGPSLLDEMLTQAGVLCINVKTYWYYFLTFPVCTCHMQAEVQQRDGWETVISKS